MNINEDRRYPKAIDSLKEVSSLTVKLFVYLGKLERALSTIMVKHMMNEKVLQEEEKDVLKLLSEIQSFIDQLDRVILLFKAGDITPPQALQKELDEIKDNLEIAKQNLKDLWELRNENNLENYNIAIQRLAEKAHRTVVTLLKKIEKYVNDYNKENLKKLNFKLKWTKLSR